MVSGILPVSIGLNGSSGVEELNKAEVAAFLNLLVTVLEEHDLLDYPDKIYNMNESGFCLKNRSQKFSMQ
jgi:hypothetical protein